MSRDEEIEGVDDAVGGLNDYPLDAVFVRTETRTVNEVVKRIQNNRYILDPDFQRDFVWTPLQQSKLIESCVMRIPLPVFYVAEAPDGRIIVVDGLQRLTTFARFLGGELRLTGFARDDQGNAHALEGKFFNDLALNIQERIQDTQLTMCILDAKAPERARLDIFERVNSGEILTRQQMRNALYSGPATKWLKDAARSENFQKATDGKLNHKTMRDREAINRFCAFKLLGLENYKTGDMDSFLADGLRKLSNIPEVERGALFVSFDEAMIINRELFGDHAFRKSLPSPENNAARTVINISLFEVCAVTMSEYKLSQLRENAESLREAIVEEMAWKSVFDEAITYSTNSTRAVQARFSIMQNLLSRVLKP